jgi:hypothetical protein
MSRVSEAISASIGRFYWLPKFLLQEALSFTHAPSFRAYSSMFDKSEICLGLFYPLNKVEES